MIDADAVVRAAAQESGLAAPSKPLEAGVGPGCVTITFTLPDGAVAPSRWAVQYGGRIGSWKEVDDPTVTKSGENWSCTVPCTGSCIFRVRYGDAASWSEWLPKSPSIAAISAPEDAAPPAAPTPAAAPAPAPPPAAAQTQSAAADERLLFQAITDTDGKVPDELTKAIVTVAVKGSADAKADLARD
eukprot:COSAG01_NODE_20238_length_964_cov_1.238150_1_plen_186_part_10